MSGNSVAKWEVFEETFTSTAACANPFQDIRFGVRFSHGDHTFCIDGFYDGEESGAHIFKVRFAPAFEGSWSYRTSSSEASLDGLTGDFSCTAPVSRGGLAASAQFPNWLFRQDGLPQFIVNDGWSPHGGPDFDRYPSEEESLVFIERLAENGVNMTVDLKQLYGRQDHITDDSFLWPWETVDAEKNKFNRDRFNLRYFQRLDRQIAAARDRDLFYGVELLYDNSTFRGREWSHHPWNEESGGWLRNWDTDRLTPGWGIRDLFSLKNETHVGYVSSYLRYTIARVSAFRNVFYALGCESSNIFPGIAITIRATNTEDWYAYWGDYLSRIDPHGRLITLGDVGEHAPDNWYVISDQTADLFRHHRNNIVVTQEHTPMKDPNHYVSQLNKFGERFWQFRRPVVIGEQDLFNRGDYELERRGFWVAFVSGFFMGRVDRHMGLGSGDRFFESVVDDLDGDPAIYQYMGNMRKIVESSGMKYWRMSPYDDLLINLPETVFCLAEPDREYLVYFSFGGTATLTLPDGSFRADWYDPRTGERTASASSGGGDQSFEAPDGEDWILHLSEEHRRWR